MKKKQICQCVAGLVSVCFVVCLINTIEAFQNAISFPFMTVMLTVFTGVCTVVIWRGIMKMDD